MKNQAISAAQILILLITLLAFALRISFVEERNATIDEISTLKFVADKTTLEIATDYHTNSHLLISILARLIAYGGHWLTFYRAPSLIFGVLAIPLTYQLGRRLFNPGTGILGALLLAVAPFHIDFSVQMRGYATMTFWATVVYFCLWRGLEAGRYRHWLGLALASILTVYAHLFGALAVGASWCIIISTYLFQRWRGQPLPWSKRMLGSLVLMIGGLALLYGPVFWRVVETPAVEGQWGTQVEPTLVDGRLNVAALEDYLKVLRLYGPMGEPNSWFVLSFVGLAGLGLTVALLGWSTPGHSMRRVGLYMIIWFLAPMLVTSVGLQFIDGFYIFRRFFMFFQPLYLLLMAAGILTVGRLCERGSRHPLVGHVVVAGIVITALGAAGWKLYDQMTEDIDNQWPQVARTILTRSTNPLVICEPQGQRMEEKALHKDECMRNLEFYFQTALNEPVPWLQQEIDKIATIPGATKLPGLEGQAGEVWLVLWQREWPSTWPSLHQTPHVAGLTYYSIGSTLLIQTPKEPAQLLALAEVTDALIPLETTPQDRFSYYMSQAQMKAVIGDRQTARAAWLAARALSPEGIDAPNRLQAVARLIGLPEAMD